MKTKYIKTYSKFLNKFLKPKRLVRIVFDCSSGAAGLVLAELLKLNKFIKFKLINSRPDGNFPAHSPNPLVDGALDGLAGEVVRFKADLGVIFDGDGDRALFLNEKSEQVSPEEIILLIGNEFSKIVFPPNIGYLPREVFALKKKIYECPVGHYFLKQCMQSEDVDFGAEDSGHFFFKKFFYCDSGILAAIFVINAVSKLTMPLSRWQKDLPKYFKSKEINFAVDDKKGIVDKLESAYQKHARKVVKIDGVKMEFGDGSKSWWFLIRPSNTEDVIRLTLESKNKKIFDLKLGELFSLIKKSGGKVR